MKILLTFRLFYYIWFIDSENLCSILILKNSYKVLKFNIVHFPNFEISASLELAPHHTVSKFRKNSKIRF